MSKALHQRLDWLKKWTAFEELKKTQAYKDAMLRKELATKMAWLNKWAAAKEAKEQMEKAADANNNTNPKVQTRWYDFWNPNHWAYNTQTAARLNGQYKQHKNTDVKIDERNARVGLHSPAVNRGSTVMRNGKPINVNVTNEQHAPAISMLDAQHLDPETTGTRPAAMHTVPRNPFFSGMAAPFVRQTLLAPNADTKTILHEGGHQRDYARRPGAWRDFLPYVFRRPIATMRMETMAEDNAYRLNQFMHPDHRLTDEAFLADRDELLFGYTMTHDPKNKYAKEMQRLGLRDGGQQYIPPHLRDLPGQPNWPHSRAWQGGLQHPAEFLTPQELQYYQSVPWRQ